MSAYSINGYVASNLYRFDGSRIPNVFDVSGNEIYADDKKEWNTEYQKAILDVINEITTDRAENVVSLIAHTDQHGILARKKATFDYINYASDELEKFSAIVGLGDITPTVYYDNEYVKMQECLSEIPRSKQINIAGNHDIWKASESSYLPLTDLDIEDFHNLYLNNSDYGSEYHYYINGNFTVVDEEHRIRYCVLSNWHFTDGVYYHYWISEDMMNAIIDMMSKEDDNDIIILSHIQPLRNTYTWVVPPTDGNDESRIFKNYSTSSVFGYEYVGLDQLIADRKDKRSGAIRDADGVMHYYDFSHCTSDILCTIHGHEHTDIYTVNNAVPTILLDAYRYDNCPIHFITINKSDGVISVAKVDESANVYKYDVLMQN